MNKNANNTKPFYNSAIPHDWEVSKLGWHTLKVGSGSTPRGGEAVYTNEGIPFIRSQNVNDDQFILENIKYIPESIHSKMSGSMVVAQDILLNITGASIGRSCVVPVNFSEGNVNQHVCIIRTTSDLCNSFLQFYISSDIGQIAILKAQVGGNREGLNHSNVRGLKIPLPPLPEQRAIAQALSLMDTARNKNNQLVAQKELSKKWLMQNLLTGKKRMKGFSGDWEEYHLGDMFAERNERNNNGFMLLSIGQNGVYPQDESIKKDTSNADKSKYKKIHKGDIGYNTMRMWQGRSALSDLEGIVSPAYTILKPKKNADSLFFSYFFKTPKLVNLFWRNSQGLVNDTLNCGIFLNRLQTV